METELYIKRGFKKNMDCLICKTKTETIKAKVNPFVAERMYLDKPPEIFLNICFSCGFKFYSPRPNEKELKRLYTGYRDEKYQKDRQKYDLWYTKTLNKNLGYHPIQIETKIKNMMTFLRGHKIKSVLDYGGDRGQFMPEAPIRYVFDISGDKPINGIKEWKGTPKKFDLVIISHLLEHLSNPQLLFKKLRNLGKIFYIEVPAKGPTYIDGTSIMHEHINFFTPKSLNIMTGGRFKIRNLDFGFCKYKVVCGLVI